jgi:hypothetical protein
MKQGEIKLMKRVGSFHDLWCSEFDRIKKEATYKKEVEVCNIICGETFGEDSFLNQVF